MPSDREVQVHLLPELAPPGRLELLSLQTVGDYARAGPQGMSAAADDPRLLPVTVKHPVPRGDVGRGQSLRRR